VSEVTALNSNGSSSNGSGNGRYPAMNRRALPDELAARISSVEADLHEGLVPAWVFGCDPQLHELERERLFPRVWSFVGHESELKKPGDFVNRYVGEDSFIFIRGHDDKLRLLFNACRHRGSQVCFTEYGNAERFQCPYHGWVYENTGALMSAPAQRDTIEGLDKQHWGLLEAPRLESYHGFYFACLSPDAPSLRDYMGDAAYYLDTFFGLIDDLEVVGPPSRYTWPVNWKAGFDGFGDDYHLVTLHRSLFDVGGITIPPAANMLGHHVITGGGHNTTISIAPSDELAMWGYPQSLMQQYDLSKLDALQADLAKRSRVLVGTIFPNWSYLIIPLTGSPGEHEPSAFSIVRLWQPRGHDKMECWNWILVPRRASQEFREASQTAAIQTFSSSGVFDQDDGVAGGGMARTANSVFGRGMKLNYQAGYRLGSARPLEDWPGPGLVTSHRYEENSFRYTIRQWTRFMLAGDRYPELLPAPTTLE
jgi:phenylpropionate dioxygenase-like ring-hydroxylating dioxygenase large terminal subunit